MTTDYVYNTVHRKLSERVISEPNCVSFNELTKEIVSDLKLALNQLIADKRLTFRKNVNGELLFYDNEADSQQCL